MDNNLKDIATLEDIKILVNDFYDKIKVDMLLGGIFHGAIKDNWPKHLDKMYRFWQTVLLEEHTYQGSPFLPHAQMPLQQLHFDRWMQLFAETIDQNFSGTIAEKAKWQAGKMAELFLSKITYYRDHPSIPLF